MARRGRGASRAAAAAARRVSTPLPPPSSGDDDMPDAPDQSQPGTPDEQDGDGEEGGTSAGDSDNNQQEEMSNPPTPRELASVPRRGRRPGRPARGGARPSDWDTPEPRGDEGSEGTPRRRGRGRGGWRGGFRGRPRYGPRTVTQATRQAVDKEGNMAEVVDDEAVLQEDTEGEEKVDKDGNLLGGREYRVRVFTIAGRGKRLYMLSTEPARCTGFRDSYLFFNKHLQLVKVIVDDYEKKDLIERNIIPHSYKGRSIGVVTARSVFREFGSKIVVGGKKVLDDYQVQIARARGDVEGEPADPFDRVPGTGEAYNRNQYVAWHGASSVYHNNMPTVPIPNGKPAFGKRKAAITSANWMFEHARAASLYNSRLVAERKGTLGGVYNAHLNMVCYPKIMQPTHARWEPVDGFAISMEEAPGVVNRTLTEPVDATTEDEQQFPPLDAAPPSSQPTQENPSIFTPLSALITRNYLVVDTHLQTPPRAALPPPGPNPHLHNKVITLPDPDDEVLVDLPEECRRALVEARGVEGAWRGQFGTEVRDGWRGELRVGVGV